MPKSGFASPAALKFMREVPPDRMRVDYVLGLIEVYDGDAAQKLRGADLHEDQINALFDEWVRVSKMTPGESSASSSSSKGTRRR
ncbi:hypothetical protein [Nocardia puris]|uniref:hypothetical protein n=1 Tax=Nocardia puris TaxID=208602 RepID=UPI0014734EC9|nr:hypothetical protein [Nocardia puris]